MKLSIGYFVLRPSVGKGHKNTSSRCQHSALGCLISGKKVKSKKGHNSENCIFNCLLDSLNCSFNGEHSEFQVSIFSNNRDITKCQSFSKTTTTSDNDHANSVTISRILSAHSRAENRNI